MEPLLPSFAVLKRLLPKDAGDLGFLGVQDNHSGERLALQFRAEIFNLLNRANFNTPNLITFTSSSTGTKTSGTAGAITSTSITSRQIQFGLKLIW